MHERKSIKLYKNVLHSLHIPIDLAVFYIYMYKYIKLILHSCIWKICLGQSED